ncbi:hypothetical protein B0H19DRAFT_1373470 [Mycena capillaripes]|nr:hypothetical protein B0H19DRAFT_1373470 [Mycena capillaripes]
MLALSNFAALLLASVVAVNAAPGVGPTPDASIGFAVYPGWDLNNGAASILSGGTELDCMKSCITAAGCLAYAYVPFGSPATGLNQPGCVLKNGIDPKSFQIQAYVVNSGLINPCGSFPVVGPTNCFNFTLA